LDEEGDMICLSSNEELSEAIRVASGIKPPILRLALVPKSELGNVIDITSLDDDSLTPSFSITTPNVTESNSNWAKKQLDYESKKQNFEHIVKISGKPFQSPGVNNVEVIQNGVGSFELESSPLPPPPELLESKKRKTVKDTVEEYSEGIMNKTNRLSEDIMEKTIRYSNQILEGTLPLSKTIHESSLLSSEYMSGKLDAPRVEYVNPVNINSYDEIVNNISYNMDQYSRNIIRDMDEKSLGVNQQTESIYKDITNEVDDYAKEALFSVNERSTQLIYQLDHVRSQVNTDVNIQFQELHINPTLEMENKLDFLSTSTIDQMTNISDNMAKNILSI